MRPPLLDVRLPAGAIADVRVIDDCLCNLAAAINHLAAATLVRLLRAPVVRSGDWPDLTELGLSVYAEQIVLLGESSQTRVAAATQAPTATRPGVVPRGVIAAAQWLPGTGRPSAPTPENLEDLRQVLNGLIEMLTATGHLLPVEG